MNSESKAISKIGLQQLTRSDRAGVLSSRYAVEMYGTLNAAGEAMDTHPVSVDVCQRILGKISAAVSDHLYTPKTEVYKVVLRWSPSLGARNGQYAYA